MNDQKLKNLKKGNLEQMKKTAHALEASQRHLAQWPPLSTQNRSDISNQTKS
jgi:hypothetical protein